MTSQSNRDELIDELQRFADDLGKSPTTREMNKYGPRYAKLYQNAFGSWNDALEAAGLDKNLEHDVPRSELLKDIERVAEALDKTPTLIDMNEHGKYSKLTYLNKLGSYVAALEELGLQPSHVQYNFSNQEKPRELEATKNVRKLRADGPTPGSELPVRSTSASDKQHGLATFSIGTGQTEPPEPVYYLFDVHEPDMVIRTFLTHNPHVLESRTRKAITEAVGKYGSKWSDAIRSVLDGFDD